MIPCTINGNKYQLPTKWEEVTMKSYRKLYVLIKQSDGKVKPLQFLSAFTGIDYLLLQNMDSEQAVKTIMPLLKFAEDWVKEKEIKVPDFVIMPNEFGNDMRVEVPKNIQSEPAGMYLDSLSLQMSSQEKDIIEIATDIIAIYLQEKYYKEYSGDERYDDKKVEILKPLIDELPCTTVLPIASFFLTKYYKLQTSKEKS